MDISEILINEETMTDIGTAIRERVGVESYFYPSEMASAILNISGTNDSKVVEDFVNGTISGITSGTEDITNICDYAFAYCSALTEVSFPACTSIGSSAFQQCSALTEVSFPACTSIGNYAFQQCSALTEVSFPNCSRLHSHVFQQCISLEEADFPACLSVSHYAFYDCSSLKEVSLPLCTYVQNSAFCECHALSTISLPSCVYIGNAAFEMCENLASLYLTGSSMVSLGASFSYVCTDTYSTMTIYVPKSLYSSYRSNTFWAFVSSRFVSV